jgi:hypothetical protein
MNAKDVCPFMFFGFLDIMHQVFISGSIVNPKNQQYQYETESQNGGKMIFDIFHLIQFNHIGRQKIIKR